MKTFFVLLFLVFVGFTWSLKPNRHKSNTKAIKRHDEIGEKIIESTEKVKSTKNVKTSKKSLTRQRIMSEYRQLLELNLTNNFPFNYSNSDECFVRVWPMENNLFEWHFSFTGIAGSDFEGGCYHGRILLPNDYPNSAPSICLFTQNGRWQIGKDICLSATSYHQETWDLNWNLRSLVMALRLHMITPPREIGGIEESSENKVKLAELSQHYACPCCGVHHQKLLNGNENDGEETETETVFEEDIFIVKSERDSKKRLKKKKIKQNKELFFRMRKLIAVGMFVSSFFMMFR